MSKTPDAQEQVATGYRPLAPHVELTEQFKSCDLNSHSLRWDELWKEREHLPWDQGCSNPALIELVVPALANSPHDFQGGRKPLLPAPVDPSTGARRKVLVPGCGRGYDVFLLASAGYDVTGLDISSNAIKEAKAWIGAQRGSSNESAGTGMRGGTFRLMCGDFFQDDWLDPTDNGFDIIYDYTFFCALPPERRPSWALRMSQLLSRDPQAVLLCVEYPLFKPPRTGGPPFGLSSEIYEQHLGRPGKVLEYDTEGHIVAEVDLFGCAVTGEDGLVRVAHYMATRTHDIGQGKDWVSVWRRIQVE